MTDGDRTSPPHEAIALAGQTVVRLWHEVTAALYSPGDDTCVLVLRPLPA
jgi:hypothetical protein